MYAALTAGMEFLAAVERRATRLIGGLSPGGLHQLLQGFAELAWEPSSDFLAASEAAATAGLAMLTPQELAELLIAYCRLGHQPGMQLMGICVCAFRLKASKTSLRPWLLGSELHPQAQVVAQYLRSGHRSCHP